MSEEIEYLSQEELDKANSVSKISTKFYIHYELDGSIISIVREKNLNFNSIEIEGKLVEDFISGKKNISTYKIKNPGLTTASFVERKILTQSLGLSVIPTIQTINNVDVVISQDTAHNLWKVLLTDHGKEKIDGDNIQQNIKFYVCLKDNHSFLLNSFDCSLQQLKDCYTVPFRSQYEQNLELIDIVTLKTFDSYGKLAHV